jgi:hypothetical protein
MPKRDEAAATKATASTEKKGATEAAPKTADKPTGKQTIKAHPLELKVKELLKVSKVGKLAQADEGGDDIIVREQTMGDEKVDVCFFLLEGGKEAMKELAYFMVSNDEEMEKHFKEMVLQVDVSQEAENPVGILFKA